MIILNKDETQSVRADFHALDGIKLIHSNKDVIVLAMKDYSKGYNFIYEQLGWVAEEGENGGSEYFTEDPDALRIGFENEDGTYPVKEIDFGDNRTGSGNDFLKDGYTIVKIFW